ncbi:lantibiotic dehydratase [Myxococcus sp. MISCRS1]|uniref:lantibiotic dehydratase n=1 Tax=Myxococcus sp. MISCRS1 TaxID=2996786 RepID=UPI00226FE748|nr:lantibiotic dehydratase [Myxococcus sp. MISCRS1]MCY1003614.1 lantibiotic dehydratase [Myxococcus sp. MISCRS1]
MTAADARSPSVRRAPFRHDGFLAIRTPLLPLDVLVEWACGLEAPGARPEALEAALARDRVLLRQRLRAHVEDPLVREALFIASPSLMDSLSTWLESPGSEAGQKVEHTLVRYLARMAGRATPFGLFAGHAVGDLGETASLRIQGRTGVRRHTRLDMDYVSALVSHVSREPEVRRALRYVPNSSLYRAGGQLRYMESRLNGRERSYHLVAVEPEPHLETTLEKARGGAPLATLANALVSTEGVSEEEALEYLESLVQAQLLVSTWAPVVTGPEPLPSLLESARDLPALSTVSERLTQVTTTLTDLDSRPPGLPPETYREVARTLEALPVPVELSRLFQVDMFRPAHEVRLPRRVLDEVVRGVTLLQRISPAAGEGTALGRFRQRLLERYEGRPVPLLEALDEESGVGFMTSRGPGAGTGPLLAGFFFPGKGGQEGPRWEPRWTHLLHRLESVRRSGAVELVLDESDLQALEARRPARLPESFGVVGTVLADSPEAVEAGRFRFLLENVHGPSGALYLGRFCHGDKELEAAVRRYLQAEEALRPDALFAEVVHMPEGRVGNILCRPALREHDLVFLGRSGLPESSQLPMTDLWVSVEGHRIVLRSGREGREVVPRLTNAHNFGARGLGAYRFLGALQSQDVDALRFEWGPLSDAPFLPRVAHGRLVLSPATWRVRGDTLKAWGAARGVARFEAVQRHRDEARLPRWVCLSDADNQLPVDLDNVLSVESLVQVVKARPYATLEELLPGPGDVCIEGETGRYSHEVVIPFLRHAAEPPRPATRSTVESSGVRTFPPGSEWLYVKLYGGTGTLDRLLRTTLGEAIRAAVASGASDRWFFIRYHDPEPHVRLRFHGAPRRLDTEVWPLLRDACARALASGEAWRLQLDTYEREVERYGGPAGMEACEAAFQADSEAVLAMLEAYPGDAGAETRWRLGVKGLDALLEDLGMDLDAKLEVMQRLRRSFGAEFKVERHFEAQLSTRFRKEARALEALLQTSPDTEGPWKPGLRALQRRSEAMRPVVEHLRHAQSEGRLSGKVEALAESLLHMHVNRLLPADQRAQELILYDFLTRLYRSRRARTMKT